MKYHQNSVRHFIVLVGILIMLVLPTMAQPESITEEIFGTLVHSGLERTYHLFKPLDVESVPLVIAFHANVTSGKALQTESHLDRVATENGFAVVFPNSAELYWDDGRVEAGLISPEGEIDDLGFIDALIDELAAEHDIDPDQVYLTGIGSGGGMVHRLACETPERFAGMAVVGASMWDYMFELCPEESTASLDTLMIHGTHDIVYPVQGRAFPSNEGETHRIQPLNAAIEFWAERNGCDPDSLYSPTEGIAEFATCAADASVALVGVRGGGHNWLRTGDYALNPIGIDAASMIVSFFSDEEDWTQFVQDPEQTVPQDYTPRTWNYYVPTSYDESEPVPLVFLLHGRPSNGTTMAFITEMNDVAEAEGFVAVYPDGLGELWNYTRGDPLFPPLPQHDTAFLTTLINDLAIDLNVDRHRVYVTGFSNGGFMTMRLACEAPDVFAALAPIAGSLYPGAFDICEQSQEPVPMLIIHGSADPSIPWEGSTQNVSGLQEPLYTSYPIPQVLAFWVAYNGCALEGEYEALPESGNSPGMQVLFRQFEDCDERGALEVYLIEGGGHTWPGVQLLTGLGPTNMDIEASQVIWDFFSRHTLEQE